MSNTFIPLCNDLYSLVFSFLLYTESISLQQCSKYSLQQKEKMEKYCQHIHPHGKVETYDRKTKLILKENNYKEGKLYGIQKRWYENTSFLPHIGGQLFHEENWKEGEYNGIQKYWYSSGQLMHEKNYFKGKKEGIQKSWYPTGQLHTEKNYYKNIKEGIQKKWYKNGQLFYEQIYYKGNNQLYQGQKDGMQKFYVITPDGKIITRIEKYKNGQSLLY